MPIAGRSGPLRSRPRGRAAALGAWVATLVLVGGIGAGARAQAAREAAPSRAKQGGDHEGGKRAFLEGERLFQLGRFEQAIDAYERAYALDPRPAFLFNIALAHRRQFELDGRVEHLLRARTLYRNFLGAAPRERDRRAVEQLVAELSEQVERIQAEAKAKERDAAAAGRPEGASPPQGSPASPMSDNVAPTAPVRSPATPASPDRARGGPGESRAASASSASLLERAPAPARASRTKWIVLGTVGAAVVVGAVIAIGVVFGTRGPAVDGPTLDLTGGASP